MTDEPADEEWGEFLFPLLAMVGTLSLVVGSAMLHWVWPAAVSWVDVIVTGVLASLMALVATVSWMYALHNEGRPIGRDVQETFRILSGLEPTYRWAGIALAASLVVLGGALMSQFVSARQDSLEADRYAVGAVERVEYVGGKGGGYWYVATSWTDPAGKERLTPLHLEDASEMAVGDDVPLQYRWDPPRAPAFPYGQTDVGLSPMLLIAGAGLGLFALAFIAWNAAMLTRHPRTPRK